SLVFRIAPDHELFLKTTFARNDFTFRLSPTAVSSETTFVGRNRFLLPPASPFYPHDFARAFGIDGTPLNVYWRAQELGDRAIEPTTRQWNIVAGMRSVAAGWRYDGAFDYSRGEVETRYNGGFVRESLLLPILDSGAVDPFAANAQDIVDRMSTAKIDGIMRSGTSSIASVDLHASRDVLALPAGPLLAALGATVFQERLTNGADPVFASGDVLDTRSSESLAGSRNVFAAFAETSVPLYRSLEVDLALRYDHYSDFGGTANPKISVRWQPKSKVLLRASAGTGFLAPSLQGLALSPSFGVTQERHDDPARCPFTMSAQDCDRLFSVQFGGNPALRPVTSTQWSAGGVWSPLSGLSLGVDYVSIALDNRINFFSIAQIFGQCPDGVNGRTCYLIHRGPIDPRYPALPGPIVQVDQFLTNLGKAKVSAIDVDAHYASPPWTWGRMTVDFSGTYNIQHLEQQADGSYVDLVGRYSASGGNPGVIPRWRHYLVIGWSFGRSSITMDERYQTGAYDQFPVPGPRRIGDYDLWDVSYAYRGFPGWTLSAGIRNLFDRDPPFSNQNQNPQVGYDPSYADPRGRQYWVGVKYAFR
ncbi:MAG TPA: TonB-dependent receptor, partial [Casimicrobiaceae bacterium]|nr:TonB-dependent receptor [Casimicrobiaceae bacterium]